MEEKRLFDLLERYKTQFPEKEDVLASKEYQGWRTWSSKDYVRMSELVSFGLMSMGFKKGQRIVTVSNNRPEWNFMDMGMMQAGLVHVPIYPNISDEEYLFIFEHSEASMLIVSDEELFGKLAPIAARVPAITKVFTFNKVQGATHWEEIIEEGKKVDIVEYREKLESIKAGIKENDLATIIYTSGTTGMPKGVMLSHWNFMYQVQKLKLILKLDSRHKSLSFLPLCHVLERIGGYTYQYLGISIYYAESIEKIADNLKEVQPEAFITVPRLLERVYDKIIAKGKELKGIKRNLFFWAVELGLRYNERGNGFYYNLRLKLADRLIFSKWRQALGGKIQIIVSGGAALQPRLARIFWAAGIPIQEGYGLTETAPVITANHEKYPNLMIGTVGIKIGEEQEIKIAGDGEILFKGPNLMIGYLKDDALTRSVIDDEGWFHTGDVGEIVEGRFLKITDRKKEMFKLSTGKYVAPQPVENIFKESLFIEQIMVVGENQKHTGALISPNFEFLHAWCFRKNIHFRENKDLIQIPEVISRYQEEVDKYNERLGKTEQIKKFSLVCEEWTPQGGELSPTLKLRRRFVEEKYRHRILEIYPEYENTV